MPAPALAAALALVLAPVPTRAAAARDGVPRERAAPTFGVRLGAASATSSAAPDTLTPAGGGGYVLFDIPGLLADLSVDLYAGESRSRLVAAGIGAYAPLGDAETIPYVGGGLKLGWSRFGGDGAFGLLPYVAGGLLIGRSWSPHVRVELAWFFTTAKERREPELPSRRASGPMATLGIGF